MILSLHKSDKLIYIISFCQNRQSLKIELNVLGNNCSIFTGAINSNALNFMELLLFLLKLINARIFEIIKVLHQASTWITEKRFEFILIAFLNVGIKWNMFNLAYVCRQIFFKFIYEIYKLVSVINILLNIFLKFQI